MSKSATFFLLISLVLGVMVMYIMGYIQGLDTARKSLIEKMNETIESEESIPELRTYTTGTLTGIQFYSARDLGKPSTSSIHGIPLNEYEIENGRVYEDLLIDPDYCIKYCHE